MATRCGWCGIRCWPGVVLQHPTPRAYTGFLQSLYGPQKIIDEMFGQLVEALRDELPEFGRHLAADSKAIQSHARRQNTDGDEELERGGIVRSGGVLRRYTGAIVWTPAGADLREITERGCG